MSYLPKILIADDMAAGREMLKDLLGGGDYELFFAEDGIEAIEKAAAVEPDIILLDIMMPKLDGYSVCRTLRKDPVLKDVPIIMLSALDDRPSRIEGLEAGADDFISKPYDRIELRARVATITRLGRYRKLNAERERFAWALEQSENAFIVTDRDDVIIQANESARHMFDLPEDLNGLRFADAAGRRYRLKPKDSWAHWPMADASIPRYLLLPETGANAPQWFSITFREHAEGEGTLRIIRIQDVTANMTNQRNIWSFHNFIQHKLRTPLTAIFGTAQLLVDESEQLTMEEVRSLAKSSFASTQRLVHDIETVLAYLTMPQTAIRSGLTGVLELYSLAEEVCRERQWPSPKVVIEDSLKERTISISRAVLEMLLVEFIGNAHKFSPSGKAQVEITATLCGGDAVRIDITDDGDHLPPDVLAKAWTPYYQGKKDHSGNVQGMGLGLAMAASFIWQVGGQCTMMNRTGAPGVTIRAELPLK